jgi:hypothetical protein
VAKAYFPCLGQASDRIAKVTNFYNEIKHFQICCDVHNSSMQLPASYQALPHRGCSISQYIPANLNSIATGINNFNIKNNVL